MMYFVLALLVTAVGGVPTTDNDAVELIVNGVPEGEPLDIGDVIGINVKEHVDGVLASSSDLLYPLTAAGIAGAAAEASPVQVVENQPQEIDLEPVFVDTPLAENEYLNAPIAVNPIVLPEPGKPDVAEPEVAPEPSPIVIEPIPQPAAQGPSGEIYNDGKVQVQLNAPEDASVLSTLQSWFNLFVNYVNNGIQTAQQVV
jgi:hypothetical protein